MALVPTTERTWTATIEIGANEFDVDISAPNYFAGPGVRTTPDLLRETAREAERQAAEYLRQGDPTGHMGTEARVHMHKTTKARGTEYDRQAAFLWIDENGTVYVQR